MLLTTAKPSLNFISSLKEVMGRPIRETTAAMANKRPKILKDIKCKYQGQSIRDKRLLVQCLVLVVIVS